MFHIEIYLKISQGSDRSLIYNCKSENNSDANTGRMFNIRVKLIITKTQEKDQYTLILLLSLRLPNLLAHLAPGFTYIAGYD